eukprot:CAMPEP_0194704318 /NCGR_PEP_ID=MMETSP0295-20121207/28209_1 /TAXON_ID=39354 /ORGANISM="Heterosigma akashiwo, Strain CCMP2393" /LENGTH=455 /DNA_ID=CAMNT_0039599675 /DNA_START=256 /DNA_END=1625 /DNA_ORIENTATION=+
MTEGDLVTVNLGGFTTGNLSTNGSDLSMGAVVFASGYNPLFGGQWTEGEFVSQEMGFYNSTLRVTLLNTSYAAGEIVARSTGIRAQCGIDGATPHWWLKVEAAAANTSLTYFDTTEAVGPGCRHLSYCSDAGTCDYCLQKCTCYEGFGATTDIADIDISLDCSEKVCPAGPAFGHLPASSTDGHAPRECSAAGACNRNTGECLCFTGWWGRACERHECPSSEGIACSGHGRCFKMKDLAKFSDAMPLSNRNTSNATIEYWGMDADGTLADSVWDAEMGSGCVCDSSWEVGLESNQTQAAEWFGPACELRRCPSGDDPMTSEIDEEDCEGVAAAGGRGVGKEGNGATTSARAAARATTPRACARASPGSTAKLCLEGPLQLVVRTARAGEGRGSSQGQGGVVVAWAGAGRWGILIYPQEICGHALEEEGTAASPLLLASSGVCPLSSPVKKIMLGY